MTTDRRARLRDNPRMLWHLPIARSLAGYRRADFAHDLTAGAIVGVVTVPQAMAYAFLAGLPAEAGLYACLLPMLLYALLGSSRELVVGPVAIAALMVAATLAEHARGDPAALIDVAGALCLEVGALLWLLRLFRMGGVVNLLSHPVLAGFVNAAAILIIVSQLPPLAGLPEHAPANAFAQALALPDALARQAGDARARDRRTRRALGGAPPALADALT